MLAEWLAACVSRPVVRRALWSALIVGSILIAINHGEALLERDIDAARVFRIVLTVIVPYVVSTVSSVSTLIAIRRGKLD